jgi:nonribosomal peptide synthetase DhbF
LAGWNWIVQSVSDFTTHSDRAPLEGATPIGEALPLTAAQLGIWFAQKLDPQSSAYNIGEYLDIQGPVDPDVFERALGIVVREAETLGVHFVEQSGEPRQILGTPAVALLKLDYTGKTEPVSAAEAWMLTNLARPVDLTRGPLFQFALIKISEARWLWRVASPRFTRSFRTASR